MENEIKTLAVCLEEGGIWQKFTPETRRFRAVHAILFSNGKIWDTANGFRSDNPEYAKKIKEWIDGNS